MELKEQTAVIVAFIRSIGIEINTGIVPENAFLPGIEIVNGQLVYDENILKYPGDLLHEAGHVALVPEMHRPQLTGNVAEHEFTTNGEEIGVMLWTYAACKSMGIPPDIVFHSQGYKGQSLWLLNEYASGNFIGLPLLQWMGLCGRDNDVPPFPHMIKWMRD